MRSSSIWWRTSLLAKFDVNLAGVGIQAGDRDLSETILHPHLRGLSEFRFLLGISIRAKLRLLFRSSYANGHEATEAVGIIDEFLGVTLRAIEHRPPFRLVLALVKPGELEKQLCRLAGQVSGACDKLTTELVAFPPSTTSVSGG